MTRKLIAVAAVVAAAAALAGSAFGYGSPIGGCQHSPTPQLCAH